MPGEQIDSLMKLKSNFITEQDYTSKVISLFRWQESNETKLQDLLDYSEQTELG